MITNTVETVNAAIPKRMAAYCRVSTNRKEQQTSLENQERYFKDYAQQKGYMLVKIYHDKGITGTSLKKRDDFNRMIRDSAHDMFDLIAVKDVKRFARNTVDGLAAVRTLRKNNVQTEFTLNNLDGTIDSEMYLTMYFGFAQKESTDLSKSVSFGKQINAKKGRVPLRIFGYDRIDNYTLALNPEESNIVRDIFDWYVNHGMGTGTISTKLNNIGVQPKLFGKMWYPKTIIRILQNKIYIGILENNKSATIDVLEHERTMRPKSEWNVLNRPQFRIVDNEIFYMAQDKMERNQQLYQNKYTHIQGKESSRHLFSTLIKCENCGYSYEKREYERKYDKREYYICSGMNTHGKKFCDNCVKIEQQDITNFVLKYLHGLIYDDNDFIKSAIKRAEKEFNAKMASTDIEHLKNKKAQLNRHCRKNKELYLNDMMSFDEYKAETAILEKEIKQIECDLCKNDKEIVKYEKNTLIAELQKKNINYFLNIKNITNADLKKVIDYIKIGKDGIVNIYLKSYFSEHI